MHGRIRGFVTQTVIVMLGAFDDRQRVEFDRRAADTRKWISNA
jgi:hypothetical protein